MKEREGGKVRKGAGEGEKKVERERKRESKIAWLDEEGSPQQGSQRRMDSWTWRE